MTKTKTENVVTAFHKMTTSIRSEQDAIDIIYCAFEWLRRNGWQDSSYCPKDGSGFEIICPGSTGIFGCFYSGEWPDGHFMVEDGCDIYPHGTNTRPLLFRALKDKP